ncbi:MAG: hypothetical protein MI976_22105 [Pseudomonadales bacterium]|nr:hypothetical protein [Pseudomonadales bacterium]
MKILCVLYGIGRGLEKSEPSICHKILEPLRECVDQLKVVYILNEVKEIDNSRSGDFGAVPSVIESVFGGCDIYRSSEEEFFDGGLYELTTLYPDIHNDNYKSNRNLICQLGMLKKASEIADFSCFDRVILCRDDLVISNKTIDWGGYIRACECGPVVSFWHWHNGIGERFVIAKPRDAKRISKRADLVHLYLKEYDGLNAEYLQRFCFEYYKLKPAATNLKLIRSRLGGNLEREKFVIALWRPTEVVRSLIAWIRFKLFVAFSVRI